MFEYFFKIFFGAQRNFQWVKYLVISYKVVPKFLSKTVIENKVDQKLSETKIIEGKDLKEKDQSSPLNQNKTNSDDELRHYLEQKK